MDDFSISEAARAKSLETTVLANVAQLLSKAEKIKAKAESSTQTLVALQKYFDQVSHLIFST